jgi:pimeloyl-ACP methyl ester carboxylesterase
MAADQRPNTIERVVLVGGFPAPNGSPYADFFPAVDGLVPFPGWEPFAGPDSVDLDDAARHRMASEAVPVLEAVAKGIVALTDERRFAVPVTVVCPEFTPDQATAWIEGGQVPELAAAANVSLVDIDTGHWPMVTQPAELATIFDNAAAGT